MRRCLALIALLVPVRALAEDADLRHEAHAEHEPAAGQPLRIPAVRGMFGTAWQPDATPHRGLHLAAGDLDLMVQWRFFGSYIQQTGPRGADGAASTGWLMLMAAHPLAGGQLGLRAMVSPEPWTVGGEGYPMLLQTGETWQGEPLVDRQHPHDLWMELATTYAREVGRGFALQLYLAAVGEPALGPVAFPHRESAAAHPLATLGHHWQDSTHIAHGVATLGLFTQHVKLEGSWFNGREPGEERADIDLRRPDSGAARLSVNPTPELALQGSYAFLAGPEAHEPDVSVQRVTASVAYAARLGAARVAAAGVYGHNRPETGRMTESFLLEGKLGVGRHDFFGRFEVASKPGGDLLVGREPDESYRVGSLGVGYLVNVGPFGPVLPGVGVLGSVHPLGPDLGELYGTRVPASVALFLRLEGAEIPSRE